MSVPTFRVTIGYPDADDKSHDFSFDEDYDEYYVESSDFEFEVFTGESIFIERLTPGETE